MALGRDPAALGAVKRLPREDCDTCQLFDTPSPVENPEGLYEGMAAGFLAGALPVPDLDNLLD